MNNLSHSNNIYVIFSSILVGLLITTLISSPVLVLYANAGTTNMNNTNTNTIETNPNLNTNTTNILYHIDQAQKAIQMGNITSALRHLDLAKQADGKIDEILADLADLILRFKDLLDKKLIEEVIHERIVTIYENLHTAVVNSRIDDDRLGKQY
jgi:hypothetical protein